MTIPSFLRPDRPLRAAAVALLCSVLLGACGQAEKQSAAAEPTISGDPAFSAAANSPSAGVTTGAAPSGGAAAFSRMSPAQVAMLPVLTPNGAARYNCVRVVKGERVVTPILMPEGSERVCSRFPAMGPCKYERDVCRAKGGKVIRFDGAEITPAVEAEYDKQVMRFRLRS